MKVELSVSIYLWKLRAKVKFSFDRKVVLFSVFLYRYRGNRSGICGYGDVYRPDILQKRYQTENGCSEKLTVSQRVSRKFPENLARNVSVKPNRA